MLFFDNSISDYIIIAYSHNLSIHSKNDRIKENISKNSLCKKQKTKIHTF